MGVTVTHHGRIVRDMQTLAKELGITSDLLSALWALGSQDYQRARVDITRALHQLGVSDVEIRAMFRNSKHRMLREVL